MTATASQDDVMNSVRALGTTVRAAACLLAQASTDQKNQALLTAADLIEKNQTAILAANEKDMAGGQAKGLTEAMMDRLKLDPARIKAMADGVRAIAALPDPVGSTIASWDRPNGLTISRVRTPLGVLGIIYESRPNVTVDVGALCLKSGNGVIMRGGSESFHSSQALIACVHGGMHDAGLPAEAISLIDTTDRAAVGAMLSGLDGTIDVIIPRGGRSLVERVQHEARIPVIGHLEGLVHVYVDGAADLTMAKDILVNAKMRRTGVCGAAETLLVDRAKATEFIPALTDALTQAGCAVRGDEGAQALDTRITPATTDDWRTEYLAPVISIALVDGVDGAIAHIAQWSSSHTECIITSDQDTADTFLTQVDSAIVMHNASTQFADGGEFGMGAEIGIATGRIHARGPVGVEQLTTFKYQVRGTGQTRA